MLESDDTISKVYIYVVARDFGFAPNPFHGVCTLACCMPQLRSTAQVGDWVFGMGGSRLEATGKCVYGMQITQTMTFEEYWADPKFLVKQPVRNGSRAMLLGDNIYSRAGEESPWFQMDSHHSYPDGSPNQSNVEKDTSKNKVLASERFLYFGSQAPEVPSQILQSMGYSNGRGHRVFSTNKAVDLLEWFEKACEGRVGCMVGEPFDFRLSGARYSAAGNKILKEDVAELGQ